MEPMKQSEKSDERFWHKFATLYALPIERSRAHSQSSFIDGVVEGEYTTDPENGSR
jgi:hypothetical protein